MGSSARPLDSERSSHFVCLQWLGSVSPALMALRVHNDFSRTVSPRGERSGFSRASVTTGRGSVWLSCPPYRLFLTGKRKPETSEPLFQFGDGLAANASAYRVTASRLATCPTRQRARCVCGQISSGTSPWTLRMAAQIA
jgi:hypothetical protein